MENQDNDRFFEGEHVKVLIWPDESIIKVGVDGVEKITVVMENGQMSSVTWFAVWKNGKIVQKCNSAHIDTVRL